MCSEVWTLTRLGEYATAVVASASVATIDQLLLVNETRLFRERHCPCTHNKWRGCEQNSRLLPLRDHRCCCCLQKQNWQPGTIMRSTHPLMMTSDVATASSCVEAASTANGLLMLPEQHERDDTNQAATAAASSGAAAYSGCIIAAGRRGKCISTPAARSWLTSEKRSSWAAVLAGHFYTC